jgi:hypothetical protein
MVELTRDENGQAAQVIRLGRVQTVSYSDTAGTITNGVGQSQGDSAIVRVLSTTDAHIAIGPNPTATQNDTPIPANVPEYFGALRGDKVSAIRQSGGDNGTLYVTEPV